MTATWPSANPCYMASNVPLCPPLSRCCILYLRLCKRSWTDHPGAPPLLLWTQGNQPLLLCRPTSPSPGLLRHLCQWNCHVCGGWIQPHVFSRHHPHLLHFHLYSHSANAFSRREAQGPLHLRVSSDSCHYVLWDTVLDVSEAAFSGICRTDRNCSCVLYLSPMLNPLIYSLWNKDVKRAIRRVIQEKLFVNWVHVWPEVCNIFVFSDRLERILN